MIFLNCILCINGINIRSCTPLGDHCSSDCLQAQLLQGKWAEGCCSLKFSRAEVPAVKVQMSLCPEAEIKVPQKFALWKLREFRCPSKLTGN